MGKNSGKKPSMLLQTGFSEGAWKLLQKKAEWAA